MILYYVMDPMCSWCWGFRPRFEQLLTHLCQYHQDIAIRYVMGGLAPDSNDPMPIATQKYVQTQWHAVTEKTGAQFNWDFWTHCQPRRSTYPACRAVIAAGQQDADAIPSMILAIQRAYYEQARNPSDDGTLIALAYDLGLDATRFTADLNSPETQEKLAEDFALRDRLGVNSFPSVILETPRGQFQLASGQTTLEELQSRLTQALHS